VGHSDRGAYERVARTIRERIADGTYPSGSDLPSTGKLGQEFDVAVGTMARALRVLDEEGLTVPRRGRPRRVADPGSSVGTRYEVVAEALRGQIAVGNLRAGMPLPSEATLAEEHGVARHTVQAALRLLEQAGEVVSRPGRARVVAGATPATDARYEQVGVELRQAIRRRAYRPGDKLPSEQDLAAMYGVSRVTVREALALLSREGLVEAVSRKGHFVRGTVEEPPARKPRHAKKGNQ
jgi:DNA-binding GntR family transcriptional regulator